MQLAGITWWRNNYGSILQAYALQQELNSMSGVEYEIINQYGKKIVSADNFIDKLHTIGLKKTMNRVFWKFGFKKLRKRSYKIQNFVDKYLRVSTRQYNQDNIAEANAVYDGFICGSDQIWNPNLTRTDSMYWLTFADKSKLKMSYAPSIGVKELNAEQAKQISENLKNFNAVSCREESGTELINSVLKKDKCVTVLDPTLMVDRSVWDELCTERTYKFKYIFVYMLRGDKAQRKQIEAFAKKKQLTIITMPFLETEHIEWYDMKFGDIKVWDASPDEFINLIRNAEYVFTDSFHSTVFSCLYHKNFFIFQKLGNAQMTRLENLQNMLGIESRVINDTNTIEDIETNKMIDWKAVDSILHKKRVHSQSFLKRAVGCE